MNCFDISREDDTVIKKNILKHKNIAFNTKVFDFWGESGEGLKSF